MFIPIKYNIRYLMRRWSGTLVTVVTFGLVIAVFIIVMSLAQGLERAFVSTGDPLNVLILRPGAQSEMQSSVMISRYQTIRNYRGIARDSAGEPLVAPEVLIIVNKPKNPDGKPSNLQVRGIHPNSLKMRPELKIVEGRMFTPGMREAIVSKSVADRFMDMGLGATPHLGKGPWTVVGIFDAGGTAYGSEMWTDYQELMQEFDRDSYSTVVVRAIDKAAAADLARMVDEDTRVKLEAKTELQYYEEQTTSAGPIKALGAFLATIMAVGACFAAMNTMYANVAGRVKEVGTLRVLGFTRRAILLSFLIESMVLGLIGGLAGCLFSLPMNGIATGTTNFQTFSEVVFFFTITPELMMNGLVFAVFMGALGGILPAITAARKPIVDALRDV